MAESDARGNRQQEDRRGAGTCRRESARRREGQGRRKGSGRREAADVVIESCACAREKKLVTPNNAGILVEEELGPDHAIERLGSARAAFVGRTLRGPVNRPLLI